MKMDVDLEHLTEAERDAILSVLNRDERLREKEQTRIRQLRTEVKQIRLKGVIKAGSDPNKTCARCRQPFGWLFNKGTLCPQCQHRVCEKCECKQEQEGKWLCVLCFKQAELEAMSGQWFYSKFRKSKRNKKTNQVISGPDLVKASIRRRHSTGAESRGSSVTDDIKRALSNNNASPKSLRSSISVEGESSDTQSMEGVSPSRRRGHIQDVSFPRESDRRKLKDLMRPKEPASSKSAPANVLVKKVLTARYDSESSSDSSEPSSPQLSNRTESGIQYSDSIRSSVQSDAVSLQSSEGHMTVVTETNISDIETMSHVSPQSSPYLGASRLTLDQSQVRDEKSSDSVIDHPSHLSEDEDSSSVGFDATDATVAQKTSSSQDHFKSSSSESEEEYTTEQITKIKFRRVSMQKKTRTPLYPRTPSPPPDLKPRSRTGSSNDSKSTEHTGTASTVTVVSSNAPSESGSTSAQQQGEEAKKYEDDTTASVTSVPSIAITHPDRASLQAPSEHDSLGELYADENIDELFASHGTSSLGRQRGLLSPFGDSRESIVSYYSDAGEGNYGNIPITGDVLFGLDYNYKTGSLEVTIKQCKDLAPVDAKKKRSDPYVKTYLLPDRTKSGKRKTRKKKKVPTATLR